MECKECKTRNECEKLCYDAEKYVNQDYVAKQFPTFTELEINENFMNLTNITDFNDEVKISLTNTEFDVLSLKLQGNTTEEIADELYIIDTTVRVNLYNIRNKLNVIPIKNIKEETRIVLELIDVTTPNNSFILTKTELKVLALMLLKFTREAISKKLNIRKKQVRWHIHNIRKKI